MMTQYLTGGTAQPVDPATAWVAMQSIDEIMESGSKTRMLDLSGTDMYAGCSCTACAACASCAACLACLSCIACLFPPLLVEVTAAASVSAISTATIAATGIAVSAAVSATKG